MLSLAGLTAYSASWKIGLGIGLVLGRGCVIPAECAGLPRRWRLRGRDQPGIAAGLYGRKRVTGRLHPDRGGVDFVCRAIRGDCDAGAARSTGDTCHPRHALPHGDEPAGHRESGAAFAVPTYIFMSVLGMAAADSAGICSDRCPTRRPLISPSSPSRVPACDRAGPAFPAARVCVRPRDAHRRRSDCERRAGASASRRARTRRPPC